MLSDEHEVNCDLVIQPDESFIINAKESDKTVNGYVHDKELLNSLKNGSIKSKDLEKLVNDSAKAVEVRREYYSEKYSNLSDAIGRIPYQNYDYDNILGQCCEEVIGYVSIPVGLATGLIVDGNIHSVPLATTEGCLLASTVRGAKATSLAGGITTAIYRDQMTRAPVIRFDSITRTIECMQWVESNDGFQFLKAVFDGTSRFGSLQSIKAFPSGNYLHLRFSASTGEAMGMNIVCKGTEAAIIQLKSKFPDLQLVSISGNMCCDKKPAAINWILGRGKSVMAECRLSHDIVGKILKTDALSLQKLCMAKNFSGSAMAGSAAGGYNAHAANVVAAIFAATGQDLAQVVESSNCITQFEAVPSEGANQYDLIISCTMPSIEIGTVGGGTKLAQQRACIDLLQLDKKNPAAHFARIICATVLCAELSLMSALVTNDLVKSHLLFNRKV